MYMRRRLRDADARCGLQELPDALVQVALDPESSRKRRLRFDFSLLAALGELYVAMEAHGFAPAAAAPSLAAQREKPRGGLRAPIRSGRAGGGAGGGMWGRSRSA